MNEKGEMITLLKKISYRHSTWEVFSDWVEIMAITISNSCDKVHYEEREKQYMDIIKKYNRDELDKFAKAFACLMEVLNKTGVRDILGEIFHELELHNKYKGQFFSPLSICEMMGNITIGEKTKLNEKGYMTICEPCCGSSAMVLGAARTLQKAKMNFQRQMVVFANDIDLKCVHICYVQLSLLGIPAVVQHGNSLTYEEWSRWYTPIYLLDNWIWREKMTFTSKRNMEDEKIKCWLEPMYRILVYGLSENFKTEEKVKKRVKERAVEIKKNIENCTNKVVEEQEKKKDLKQPKFKKVSKDLEGQLNIFSLIEM